MGAFSVKTGKEMVRGQTTGQGLPVRVITLSSLPPGEGQYANKQTNRQKAIQFSKSLHS